MKASDHDTGDLSSGQVRSLLALGLSTTIPPQSEHSEFETLQAALDMRDKRILKMAISDLQSPIESAAVGPVSLQRLTGIDLSDLEPFRGKTFLDVLSSPVTNILVLNSLEQYGTLLANSAFPESTRLVGSLIRLLSQVNITRQSGKRLVDESSLALLKSLFGSNALLGK